MTDRSSDQRRRRAGCGEIAISDQLVDRSQGIRSREPRAGPVVVVGRRHLRGQHQVGLALAFEAADTYLHHTLFMTVAVQRRHGDRQILIVSAVGLGIDHLGKRGWASANRAIFAELSSCDAIGEHAHFFVGPGAPRWWIERGQALDDALTNRLALLRVEQNEGTRAGRHHDD